MLTVHIREFCQVSPGPLPRSACRPGYEAKLMVPNHQSSNGGFYFLGCTLQSAENILTIIVLQAGFINAVTQLAELKCAVAHDNSTVVTKRLRYAYHAYLCIPTHTYMPILSTELLGGNPA